ncbi:MAG: LysM peptidoglycan-binding domain-containing protein [Candidatus Spechtbacterales bacterium]|nr:LysM peptidoglycan-binding domain-containing protein [Candidatus Spechtbacterales bacterium]
MQFIKGVAVFVFIVGILATLGTDSPLNITPLHSVSGEEIVVDKIAQSQSFAGTKPFLSAKLINSVDAPTPQETEGPAIGGGGEDETIFSTSSDGAIHALQGAVIAEPPPKEREEVVTYEVRPGDTASAIAARFGLKLNTLLWSNHLRSPHYIKPGQELTILPVDGVMYEIENGDTLSSIADKYSGDVDEILDANGIESVEHIFAGQTIIIPGGEKPRVSTPSYRPRYSSSYQNLDGYFITPTPGRITQWLHGKNAVDIGGGCWQPVRAAASGTVGISIGNGAWNGGYGSYITINHPNGTRTLYAHNIRNLVWSGQWVNQGDLIAYTGSTGRSTGCHLHWEVHGARNPLAY